MDGVFIQATQLDIDTVAAGGGSVLHVFEGNMDVGPDSVGSSPGPVCYGRFSISISNSPDSCRGGRKLAVTDANFLLGRILPEYFPFPLDLDATVRAFEEITGLINRQRQSAYQLSIYEVIRHRFKR